MAETITVARYIATRLHQLGVRHLFGVPGDFNLSLLDDVLDDGRLEWVGSPNELNAAYAADAYARIKGLAAVVTTYGVGELSCINAIAGSYAEHVPVVQITGSPTTTAAAAGALLHHSLADGDNGHFARAYGEVTAASAVLTAVDAAAQIDRVLTSAVHELRPVYLGVPVDVATALVDAAPLDEPLPCRAVDDWSVDQFRRAATEMLTLDTTAVVVAGHLVQRRQLQEPLRRMVHAGALPVVSLMSSKGVLDESDPHFAGVYCGDLSDKRARAAVDNSDVMIHVGTLLTDAVSGLFSHRVDPRHTIELTVDVARVGDQEFRSVPLDVAVDVLTEVVGGRKPMAVQHEDRCATTETDADEPLMQLCLWNAIEQTLPSHSVLLAEMGTSFWAAVEITLPDDTAFVSQPVWGSIGYTLPATLGCVTADPTRRAMLVIGDGAAQMTVQELSTLAARGANPIVVLVDNDGYTIERALQSPQARYNDVATWRWGDVARALAPAADVLTLTANTRRQLDDALWQAWAASSMVLVEAKLDRDDVPSLLDAFAEAASQR